MNGQGRIGRTSRTGLRLLRVLSVLAAAAGASGCNWIILLGYLIGGPPSIEPEFDVETQKSMTDKDVVVAVVCYADKTIKWDFDSIDHEVAKYVTFRLHEHQVKVIDPDRIRAWLDQHDDWDRPEEIGEAFRCRYVVYIDLLSFSLYEESSSQLYRGRSEAVVSVTEVDPETGDGEKIFSKEVLSRFPIHAPRSTAEVTYSSFKREYLSRLSEEVGRLFYEHYNGDDVVDGT